MTAEVEFANFFTKHQKLNLDFNDELFYLRAVYENENSSEPFERRDCSVIKTAVSPDQARTQVIASFRSWASFEYILVLTCDRLPMTLGQSKFERTFNPVTQSADDTKRFFLKNHKVHYVRIIVWRLNFERNGHKFLIEAFEYAVAR